MAASTISPTTPSPATASPARISPATTSLSLVATAPRTAPLFSRVLRLAGSALDSWHLLSLDAPTVAVVWTVGFAAAIHLRLPTSGPMMLALATWLLYVADRLLDSARPAHADRMQTRHLFHRRHRARFLVVSAMLLPVLAWLVATRLDPRPRREDLVLAGCSLVYLLCVHCFSAGAVSIGVRRRGLCSGVLRFPSALRFPKELLVGIIFAAACVIPAWSRAPLARGALALLLCLFAALCWLNCVAIEFRESAHAARQAAELHATTLWVGRHFTMAAALLAAAALGSVPLLLQDAGGQAGALAALALAVACSSVGLAWLQHYHRSLTPLRLRAATDAVLLTPAVLVPAFLSLARALRLG